MTSTVVAQDHDAVVIGIDRYPALTDLRGACNDADAFHRWLIAADGGAVPMANVRVHLEREAVDARSAAPKKWEIDADLVNLIDAVRERATPQPSQLYLYFAGTASPQATAPPHG